MLTPKVSGSPYEVVAPKERTGGKAAHFLVKLKVNGTGK